MNKLTKAAIAGAAGIALLLGGAGSLAYWNSSIGVAGGTVSSGELSIAANGTPAASDITIKYGPAGTAVTFTPGTDKIIPGDIITIKQPVIVKAQGKNLTATLDIAKDTAGVPASFYDTLDVTVAAYDGLTSVTTTAMAPSVATSIDNVVVTIEFPATVTATDLQNASALLANLNVTLTQIQP